MDVTQAVSQDEIANTLVAEPEGETTENAGTEAVEQPEGEEQPLEQAEGEQVEEDADWLPTEQEKVFPPEVIAKYATRYGLTQEQLDANPSLVHLLHDKINTDIFLRQQQQTQFQEEPEPEPEPAQARPTPQPIPFQQWRASAGQLASQITSQEMATAFAQELQSCTDDKGNVNPQKLAETFTVFGMNLINSILPHYFQAPSPMEGKNTLQWMIEQQYEGIGEWSGRAAYQSAWQGVASKQQGLPQYGSPEFQAMMEKAAEAFPGLDQTRFVGKNGEPLPLYSKANAEKMYQLAVSLVKGTRPNSELVKQAVETGKRLASQSKARKQAGNLGAGNSKQQFSQQSDDEFWSKPESWNQYLDRKL